MNEIVSPETAVLIKNNGFKQDGWTRNWARVPGTEEWILVDSTAKMETMDLAAAPDRNELYAYILECGNDTHDRQLTTAFALTAMFVSLQEQADKEEVGDGANEGS